MAVGQMETRAGQTLEIRHSHFELSRTTTSDGFHPGGNGRSWEGRESESVLNAGGTELEGDERLPPYFV